MSWVTEMGVFWMSAMTSKVDNHLIKRPSFHLKTTSIVLYSPRRPCGMLAKLALYYTILGY